MATDHVGNLLGLAVLSLLRERPMHPYEISTLMRERGLSTSIKLNYGSLYSVIEGLRAKGLIAVKATEREGNHPERTVYEVTEAGVVELLERLLYLVGTPVKEYPRFVAGLTFLAQLRALGGPGPPWPKSREPLGGHSRARGNSRPASEKWP